MSTPTDPDPKSDSAAEPPPSCAGSDLLVLPDGRILAHHLTPELAAAVRAAFDAPEPS